MGAKDVITKDYMNEPYIFANAFNSDCCLSLL